MPSPNPDPAMDRADVLPGIIYTEGATARVTGLARAANPYWPGTPARAMWRLGWLDHAPDPNEPPEFS
jgi:hypothetical protein